MSIMKKFFYHVVGKKTEHEKEDQRIQLIRQLIEIKQKEEPKQPQEYAKSVAEQFYVDGVVVTKKDGSVLMSTERNGFEKAVKNSSVYEFIKTEFPNAKLLTIKDDKNYNIIYPYKDNLYLIKTKGEITTLETKKIAEKLDSKLDECR